MRFPKMQFIYMNYAGYGLRACYEILKVLLVSPIIPSYV